MYRPQAQISVPVLIEALTLLQEKVKPMSPSKKSQHKLEERLGKLSAVIHETSILRDLPNQLNDKEKQLIQSVTSGTGTNFGRKFRELQAEGINPNITWVTNTEVLALDSPQCLGDYHHASLLDIAIHFGNTVALELLLLKADNLVITQSLKDLLERNLLNRVYTLNSKWPKLTHSQLFGMFRLILKLANKGELDLVEHLIKRYSYRLDPEASAWLYRLKHEKVIDNSTLLV